MKHLTQVCSTYTINVVLKLLTNSSNEVWCVCQDHFSLSHIYWYYLYFYLLFLSKKFHVFFSIIFKGLTLTWQPAYYPTHLAQTNGQWLISLFWKWLKPFEFYCYKWTNHLICWQRQAGVHFKACNATFPYTFTLTRHFLLISDLMRSNRTFGLTAFPLLLSKLSGDVQIKLSVEWLLIPHTSFILGHIFTRIPFQCNCPEYTMHESQQLLQS